MPTLLRSIPDAAPLIYLSPQFIRAKEYFEAIVASTSDAIITTDLRGRIIYFSPGAQRMTGLGARQAQGLSVARLYRGGIGEARKVMKELLARGGLSDYETQVRIPDGRMVHVSMSAALLKDKHGGVIGTLGISKDIGRRVELEERLRSLSVTDTLTGLYNQRRLQEEARHEIARARRQRQALSLLVIDLDRFKEANDRWGHLAGDRILRQTADILRASIRTDVDSAYRYGGDEFVVLLPGLDLGLAGRVARRIRKAAASKDFAELVTLSIGAAALRPRESLGGLLRRADERMYAAKRKSKMLR